MAKKEKNQEPQYYLSRINTQVLNYNVYVMKPMEKLLFSLLLIIVGGAVGLVFYGGLFKSDGQATMATYISNIVIFVLVGLLAKKMFLPLIVDMLRNRRIKKLRLQFREFLSTISNSLSSGMNVTDSLLRSYSDLEMQFSSDAYIVKEVAELINGTQNNIAIEDMLSDFGKRSGIEDISNFATVFETAYRTGGNLKQIVRRTTDIISEKMLISEEIQTKLTSNKMQMNVMLVVPIFIMLMLKTMSGDFAKAFSGVIGIICITISIGLFFAAYKVGQKIMDIRG